MTAARRVLLVDNGSLEPASTRQLREIAAALEQRLNTGSTTLHRVEPVSLAHSAKIPASELGGRPAELLETALARCGREGVSELTVLPLFVGPSLALTRVLPALIAAQTKPFPALRVRVAEPLQPPGATGLSEILTELVREQLPSSSPVRVAVVDHGSPARAVAAARDEVAAQVRAQLGSTVIEVAACSMERRAGAEYDFNEPLLETLLARPEWQTGPVIIALLFVAPGRHAGPEGDVAQICRRARGANDFSAVKFTRVLGQHARLVELLAERCLAAAHITSPVFPKDMNDDRTLAEIVGPWEESNFKSGLIDRCRESWSKPIGTLSHTELATFLRQKIAVEYLVPAARKRIEARIADDTELYDGELAAAIEYAMK